MAPTTIVLPGSDVHARTTDSFVFAIASMIQRALEPHPAGLLDTGIGHFAVSKLAGGSNLRRVRRSGRREHCVFNTL
jgi:hypothetical protein